MTDLTKTLQGLSALAQEIRLKTFRMLMAVSPEGLPAGTISTELDIAPNKLSAHLTILTQAGLINVERSGRNMIYTADVDAVSTLMSRMVETCCHGNPQVCNTLSEFLSDSESACC